MVRVFRDSQAGRRSRCCFLFLVSFLPCSGAKSLLGFLHHGSYTVSPKFFAPQEALLLQRDIRCRLQHTLGVCAWHGYTLQILMQQRSNAELQRTIDASIRPRELKPIVSAEIWSYDSRCVQYALRAACRRKAQLSQFPLSPLSFS